ncbi:MAG: ABC transporter permease [Alphaproteobacteria bacterium]|nr:ABC transporter permease [Alphaproteobacteria bacterium]
MTGYVIYRLLAMAPVLFIVTLISFSIMQFVPGDPALVIAGAEATAEQVERIRTQLGLNRPFHEQLLAWYGGLVRADLGHSILLGRTVTEAIAERLPVTVSLALYAIVLSLIVGLGTGVVAALRHNSWVDQLCMTLSLIGVSLPNFWLAIMLIVLFAVQLGWLPTGGYVPISQDFFGWLQSATLPAVSLALMQMGLIARITRSTMLETLRQDYIRTARAKGLPPHVVVGKHALRNVMIPVVTVAGITVSLLISGAVVIETVFSVPGIGRLVASAILRRDYPVIQGGLLVSAAIVMAINLAVDLAYAWLDPRVRYGR